MAKDKKLVAPKFTSCKLKFVWPKLTEPDYGNKEFPKPNGEFSVKGVGKADDPEVQALIAKLQPFHDEAVSRGEAAFKGLKVDVRKKLKAVTVNPLYTELFDEETEEPTGEIAFKFSMTHSGEYKSGPKQGKKWYRRPAIFDARGSLMKPAPDIWGGTIGRIAFELGIDKEGIPGYFIPGTGAVGLSLRLTAVRILDLVQSGERDAASYGFDEEEEGYEYDPSTVQSKDSNEDGEDQSSGVEASGDDNPDF